VTLNARQGPTLYLFRCKIQFYTYFTPILLRVNDCSINGLVLQAKVPTTTALAHAKFWGGASMWKQA